MIDSPSRTRNSRGDAQRLGARVLRRPERRKSGAHESDGIQLGELGRGHHAITQAQSLRFLTITLPGEALNCTLIVYVPAGRAI